jgi:hypothetical protein
MIEGQRTTSSSGRPATVQNTQVTSAPMTAGSPGPLCNPIFQMSRRIRFDSCSLG